MLNHPLVDHKLTVLRDKNTPSSTFRELVSELVMLEAYEATRDVEVVDKPIETTKAPVGAKAARSGKKWSPGLCMARRGFLFYRCCRPYVTSCRELMV